MKGFLEFIREQGVVGLAVGFILGGSVAGVVSSLVEDIIDPILGLVLGSGEGLKNFTVTLGEATLRLGNFLSIMLDFLVVALVIYIVISAIGLKNLKKK